MSEPIPAWSTAVPKEGPAHPDDLVDLLWSYFEWDRARGGSEWVQPQSRDQLRALINHAFQASLHAEEDRAVRFQVLFDLKPSQVTLRFDRPIDYDVAELIRLSPTIGIGFRWLVVAPEGAKGLPLRIVGVCDPLLSPHPTSQSLLTRWVEGMGLHVSEVSGMPMSVLGPGWIRIATWAQHFFELRDLSLRFPFTIHQIAEVEKWYAEAAAGLGLKPGGLGRSLLRRAWGNVLSRVRDARHGGCFLVVPDAADLGGLIRFAYPGASDRLQEVARARMRIEPDLGRHVRGRPDIDLLALDDAHFLERDLTRMTDLLAALASVDGAVVMRRGLGLSGFGGEIVNVGAPGEDERVVFGEHPAGSGRRPPDRPLTRFGMRHRSAYRLCEKVDGAMAFVVSQDGDVRVFANLGGRVVLYEGAAPEDWVIATS